VREALADNVVLVTGASRGIGAGIAQRFAAEGAKVAICARSLEPGSGGHLAGSLEETAALIRADGGVAHCIVADLGDPGTDKAAIVAEVREVFGPLDVVVNNAAACSYVPIEQVSERRLRVAYEVNVVAPYLLVQAAVPDLRARGRGWVLNITTGVAEFPPDPLHDVNPLQHVSSLYAPSKSALNRLTVSLASELHGAGIAVNALAPEKAVRTEGATAMMDLADEWVEPMETMVEAALALVTCDPATTTGRVTTSLRYLRETEREVRTLDGRERFESDVLR
jgi:NAD(P)-dependent dehydrogenase (short-subunit alcohol dehydrogenase family)